MKEERHHVSKPLARKDGLVVRELAEETLVYDEKNRKYHCLNRSVGLVWQNCDGRRTPIEISVELGRRLGCAVDDRLVWLALRQLDKFDLLQSNVALPEALHGLSRRDLMRVAIPTMLAVPAIISIVAPNAAAAASAITSGNCNKRHPTDTGGCGGGPCTDVANTHCMQTNTGNSCHCA